MPHTENLITYLVFWLYTLLLFYCSDNKFNHGFLTSLFTESGASIIGIAYRHIWSWKDLLKDYSSQNINGKQVLFYFSWSCFIGFLLLFLFHPLCSKLLLCYPVFLNGFPSSFILFHLFSFISFAKLYYIPAYFVPESLLLFLFSFLSHLIAFHFLPA